MKRAREENEPAAGEEEKDESQLTLYTCVKNMLHRQWLREEFAGFPLELFQDVIMAHLAPHAASLLAFAMTCKSLYYGPWRVLYGHALEMGEYDEEKWGRPRFKDGEVFSQGALNLFAPFLKTLTYHLPCHHGWDPWDLKACTSLEHLTFIGNECYSGDWETPLPMTLKGLTLIRYATSNIHWHNVFDYTRRRNLLVDTLEYDFDLEKISPMKFKIWLDASDNCIHKEEITS